jgi:hypothetical protein
MFTNFFSLKFGDITINDCAAQAIQWSGGGGAAFVNHQLGTVTIDGCTSATTSVAGLSFGGQLSPRTRIKAINITNGASAAILDFPSFDSRFGPTTTSGNTVGWRHSGGGPAGRIKVKSMTVSEATKQDASNFNSFHAIGGDPVSIQDYLSAGAYRLEIGGDGTGLAVVTQETGSNRHTATGIGWKLAVTDSTYITAGCPARLRLARLMVKNGQTVNIGLYVNRSSTNLSVTLSCQGKQISGENSDKTSSAATSSAWEQLSLTLNPTEDGIVDIELIAYGGTTNYVYFDDLLITQS